MQTVSFIAGSGAHRTVTGGEIPRRIVHSMESLFDIFTKRRFFR
jgi:hypothetical protein